jgi:hypothetical protein
MRCNIKVIIIYERGTVNGAAMCNLVAGSAWQTSPMTVRSRYKNGCLFRYAHTKGEPDETLDMAVGVACTIAEGAAIDTGQNHVVARTIKPKGYAVFPTDHRALQSDRLVPDEITPESACIRLEQ